MVKIRLKTPKKLKVGLTEKYHYFLMCIKSLCYNHHLSQSYIADILLEPIFKIVDSKVFKKFLGPLFVLCCILLTSSVVVICYYVGLPWWWRKSQEMTIVLLIIGNWLLINVIFHYYKAAVTNPGTIPRKESYNAVGICKKCLMPKPPRTHHCSICNRCILKFDHHCVFLNQCVGHNNHRYFFLYMAYTVIGVIFIVIFGLEIGYDVLWLENVGWEEQQHEKLQGSLVRYNLTGHLVPVTEADYEALGIHPVSHNLPVVELSDKNVYRAVCYVAVIIVAVLIALGALTVWHFLLISRGETSVESHINKSEQKRYNKMGKTFVNPYDFGKWNNWRLFLGLTRGRSFLTHILLPSSHKPEGDGITWLTVGEHEVFQGNEHNL